MASDRVSGTFRVVMPSGTESELATAEGEPAGTVANDWRRVASAASAAHPAQRTSGESEGGEASPMASETS